MLSFWCIELFAFVHAYVNVAQNKPAYQEYQWDDGNTISDASNAVDGNKSKLNLAGGQCVISASSKQTAIWWVNLINIQRIHHITIYYRTENITWGRHSYCTSRFLGFSVYVSNTTDKLQGTLCFKDENFTLDTIPAVFTTICPAYGQYVIFYNERLQGVTYPSGYSQYAYNDICELEVYGCPVNGCYGFNNSLPCPDVNCHYCHRETGTCELCKSGYKGFQCEIVCDRGSYGSGCNETCGHCRDIKQCSNINGTCLTGCDVGYQGNLCKTPCDRGLYGSECNETCGHCRDVNQCSNINGTCLTGCDAGYQGNLCTAICEFGYYGLNCNQECSMFCKESRDCHPMSGYCKEGCKNGWQGLDCLEVSSLAMNEKNWKSAFSGILSAFCISLIFNTITIAYFIVKRIRNSTAKAKQLMMLQSDISEKGRKNDVLNVYTNETTASNYQELREFKTTETYDTPKDKKTVIE
eukprot:XP_019918272.1 PREDICTED: uncharacterized protein LOC105317082 isoform X2 [Crassostrea gigas]